MPQPRRIHPLPAAPLLPARHWLSPGDELQATLMAQQPGQSVRHGQTRDTLDEHAQARCGMYEHYAAGIIYNAEATL